MKILILKPSSLGDVVQALPVLRLLKAHQPDAAIYWWIDSQWAGLLEDDPDLAGLIPFARQTLASGGGLWDMAESLYELRNHRFDWVIDLQSLARSAVVAWLANGRLTIGLDDPREGAPAFYDVAVPRPAPDAHAVDWYLSVLHRLDVPVHFDFEWLPPRAPAAESIEKKWAVSQHRWIALQPGARWLTKRWPAARFAELARLLVEALPDHRLVILGSAEDHALSRIISAAVPSEVCLDLTGRLSLAEMVEWLRVCELMVTNDTGPMHVAAALGTPVVALFGPTDPRRTGPYGQIEHVVRRADLPCMPCLKSWCGYHEPQACLHGIAPERVVETVLRRLGEHAPTPRHAHAHV